MNMKVLIFLGLILVVSATSISPNKLHPNKPAVSGDDDCGMCKFLVGQIETYLSNNATETELLAKVEEDCKFLINPSWIAECKTVIATYGPQVLTLIASKETPDQICAHLSLCNSTTVVAPASEGSIECLACTFLVNQAEDYLQKNKSESEIISFLTNDCKILKDATWVATCQGLVAAYGPQIIQLLVNKEPANTVCSDLKLCNSSKIIIPEPSGHNVAGGAECMLCEWVLGQIETYVEANKTESEILSGLSNGCSVLHEQSFIAMCQALVSEYAPQMISLLVNEETPSKICTTVGICTSDTQADNKPHHKEDKPKKHNKHGKHGKKMFKINKH